MRYIITFFVCAAIAISSIVLWLVTTLPRGEGAFGIAKAVPIILVFGSAIIFCAIWFPANLAVFLWQRNAHKNEPSIREPRTMVVLSACVFVLCATMVGTKWIQARRYAHSPPPAQRQAELKDVKELIDGFCKKERNGDKLTPADGIYATMEQLMYNSTPDVLAYTAENLPDDSGFLWVIAASPNCPTNLFTRFLSIPSTHRTLARNSNAPPEVLEFLSRSDLSDVRARVGANANTSKDTLKRLINDQDKAVRDSAEANLRKHIQQ
jgi:hypothetical protein